MKKKLLLFVIPVLLCISIISIYLKDGTVEVLENSHTDRFNNNKLISVMLETGLYTGIYQDSGDNALYKDGYLYNETLSKCENGSNLTWNDETKSVVLKANISERCYVYFDVEPPDVYVATSNIPSTVGAQASLNCPSSTSTWNQKYNRIEVSQVNANYTTCNLSFTQRSTKTYFNNYIIGLSGTTQGIGEVVHEIAGIPDYTDATTLTQSQYGSYTAYSASSTAATSGTTVSNVFTFDGTNWSTIASTMTSGTYYHFQFTAPEDGYYNFCLTMSIGSTSNRLYLYVGSDSFGISALSSEEQSGCVEIGYVTSGTTIKVVQYAYTTISTISFNFQKVNTINSLETGYRYEGQNPNNYVWFNNELWRIIGVFDSDSHGISDTNLVKIIRANPIGGLSWNKSNTNDWTAASLMNLLNGAYYKQEDGTNEDYCYEPSMNKGICDYTNIGISSIYRGMIKNVTWNLGGMGISLLTTAGMMYGYERGDTVYSGRPINTTGYIGLMYASDYGYASLASSCARTTSLILYNNVECTLDNWLYFTNWTITPSASSSNYAFYVGSSGRVLSGSVRTGNFIHPVLYLDSNVYVIDGSGSEADPYIIGM